MENQPVRRKPGAQPRNRNAYKHGFYAKFFTPLESRLLSKIPLTDITGEIDLLRVNVDRFMQTYLDSLEQLDYADRLSGLRVITLAVGRIAALQRILTSASKNLVEAGELYKLLTTEYEENLDEPPPSGPTDPQE
jgi:hypothetical protein